MTKAIFSAWLLAAVLCSGQTPTPAQGRDYVNNVYRVVRVDSLGRLEVVGSIGGGCPGTDPTPCVVEGLAAAGAPIAGAPVQTGGSDGTNARYFLLDTAGRSINVGASAAGAAIAGNPLLMGASDGTLSRYILVDTGGRLINVGAAAAGAAVVGSPVEVSIEGAGGLVRRPYAIDNVGDASAGNNTLAAGLVAFNGATYDKVFDCTGIAAVSTSASGNTQIVAASGATRIRVCGVYLTSASPVNIKLTTGTGANCVTGNADLGGLFQITSAMALDFGPFMAMRSPASAALCVNLSGTISTTGTVIYAQY